MRPVTMRPLAIVRVPVAPVAAFAGAVKLKVAIAREAERAEKITCPLPMPMKQDHDRVTPPVVSV